MHTNANIIKFFRVILGIVGLIVAYSSIQQSLQGVYGFALSNIGVACIFWLLASTDLSRLVAGKNKSMNELVRDDSQTTSWRYRAASAFAYGCVIIGLVLQFRA